jgi:hypothetical protein
MSRKANAAGLEVSPVPSESEDEIYAAVGRALTAWERLDTALAMTFGSFVGTQHVVALRALGRIESPAARLQVLLEAFQSSSPAVQRNLPSYEATVKSVMRLTEARNAVAHGQVQGIQITGRKKGYYLVPGLSASRKAAHPALTNISALLAGDSEAQIISHVFDYALNAGRVLAFAEEFDALRAEVERWSLPSATMLFHAEKK